MNEALRHWLGDVATQVPGTPVVDVQMGGDDPDRHEWPAMHDDDTNEPDLVWTREKPTVAAYYWLRTTGYERGIIVWVFVGADGGLFIDHPINRYVDVIGGWWAGPVPEPTWLASSDQVTDNGDGTYTHTIHLPH